MAQEKDYSLKVRLTQLTGAFVKDLTGRTATKKCIIIPVDDNPCMFVGEKDVYLNIAAFATDSQQYGDTHMLKPNLPKDVREQMTDEQRRQQPILGNMRPLHQEMQSQGAPMQADQLDQPQDDLPF